MSGTKYNDLKILNLYINNQE